MMTFLNHRPRDFPVPMITNWLLNDLAEAKGTQELCTRQSPQVLKAAETKGSVAMFEFTVPVRTKVPMPHSHKHY